MLAPKLSVVKTTWTVSPAFTSCLSTVREIVAAKTFVENNDATKIDKTNDNLNFIYIIIFNYSPFKAFRKTLRSVMSTLPSPFISRVILKSLLLEFHLDRKMLQSLTSISPSPLRSALG